MAEPTKSRQCARAASGPWICRPLGEGQAGCRVPAQDVQDIDQARRHMVQHHARAGMITARGGGEDDEGPQAGDVAVLHVREVDVNLAGIPGHAGERPDQALVAVLVDLTRDEQPGLACGTGDPQLPVV